MPKYLMDMYVTTGDVTYGVVAPQQTYQIQYTTAATTTSMVINQTWYNWVDQQLTAEQVRVQALAAEAEQQRKAAAIRKAEAILKSMLDAKQRAEYEAHHSFEVLITRTGETRRYRVERGWAGNVYRVDKQGRSIERFCIHPEREIPLPDNMLAQKLLLEADEQAFLRTANRSVPGRTSGTWIPAERAA